jgi:hypothetical protein
MKQKCIQRGGGSADVLDTENRSIVIQAHLLCIYHLCIYFKIIACLATMSVVSTIGVQ